MSLSTMNLGPASLATPGVRVEPAVLDDDTDLPRAYKSLWANTSGTVRGLPVSNEDDEPITMQVQAGSPVPVAFRRLFTASTASLLGIVA